MLRVKPAHNRNRTFPFPLAAVFLDEILLPRPSADVEKFRRKAADFLRSGHSVNLPVPYFNGVSALFEKRSDITEAECKSFFKTVSLDKEEYPEIVLDLLSTGDQYVGISNPSLVELVARVLEIKSSDSVFDLGSGYGNFLVAVGYFNRDQAIRPALYGQEINIDAYNVSCMALTMCGANYHIQNINSIESTKCPAFTKGYVFPPFAIRFDRSASNQFKFRGEELFVPKTSSEWLFVFKALEGMSKTGKLAVLLPEGTLFKAQDAGIRKYLLDNNLIEGIISLPEISEI